MEKVPHTIYKFMDGEYGFELWGDDRYDGLMVSLESKHECFYTSLNFEEICKLCESLDNWIKEQKVDNLEHFTPAEHPQGADYNPVFLHVDGRWYFWDETWTNSHGPFFTRENAVEECIKYAEKL